MTGQAASGPAPVGLAHAEALAALHASAFPPAEAWSAGSIAAQLALPGCFALLDTAGGMVLLRVAADEAEILTFAVAPPARRRGLGARLLRAAMRLAARQGARVVYLEVADGNAAALALYAGAGFRRAGLRRRYYADGRDALVMRAPLEHYPN